MQLTPSRSLGSGEPIEDIYLFGTMITGLLLISAGWALAYQRIKKAETAVQIPTRLPTMLIGTIERAVASQTGLIRCSTDDILEKFATAVVVANFEAILITFSHQRCGDPTLLDPIKIKTLKKMLCKRVEFLEQSLIH